MATIPWVSLRRMLYKLGKVAWSRAFIQFFLKGCNCFPASVLGLERLFGQVLVAFSLTSKGGLMK